MAKRLTEEEKNRRIYLKLSTKKVLNDTEKKFINEYKENVRIAALSFEEFVDEVLSDDVIDIGYTGDVELSAEEFFEV